MEIHISDWIFRVDLDATFSHTMNNSLDHCECAYCRNYYECVDMIYPEVRTFLSQFGIVLEGPSELLPFKPTLLLAGYRVHGSVDRWGSLPICVGNLPVAVEVGENGTFLLWVGEFMLPWCQSEAEEDVISPANAPEFLERMEHIWYMRHGETNVFS